MAAPNLPKTIRAWTIPKSGQPRDALLLRTDFPGPKSPSGDALVVRVSHAALNPVDLKIVITSPLQDLLRLLRGVAVPGMDFAGEVVAAGPQAPAHLAAPGTRICGAYNTAPIVRGNGTLAEYITVPASVVAQQPAGWTGGAAAGLGGIAGQTAEAIMRNARVQPGWQVLLVGISGGVGSILVQMLKSAGAVVFGVCSGSNAALAKSLGADEVCSHSPTSKAGGHSADSIL
jgi:NADPH:quinone reductase-like Zn-dependent oxidoreductase